MKAKKELFLTIRELRKTEIKRRQLQKRYAATQDPALKVKLDTLEKQITDLNNAIKEEKGNLKSVNKDYSAMRMETAKIRRAYVEKEGKILLS